MIPINPESREGANFVEIAKEQPEYATLPANYKFPYIETKWKLSWRERVQVILTGKIYLVLMTFGKPIQPIMMSVRREPDL